MQIQEIFELFDTDGGGTIDHKELEFAMIALGFRSEQHKSRHNLNRAQEDLIATIAGDGTVSYWVDNSWETAGYARSKFWRCMPLAF